MKKASGLALMMSASILIAGCGSSAEESSPSANAAPSDTISSSASPEAIAEILTDGYGKMLYVIDDNNRIGIDLNGVASSENFTETIDRNVTGQIKESIRDTRLNDMKKLTEDQSRCDTESYSYSIIIPSLGSEEYRSCDYALEDTDPLFEVAELILGDYARR